VAGARVLADSILTIGLETLTGGHPAFINLTPRLLMNGAATLLPAHAAVFEITPDACCVADLTDSCRWLHQQGYTLALDGVVDPSACERLLPFMRFAKLPVSSMTADARRTTAEALLRRGIRLVATGVDGHDVAEEARAAGFGLAQGFYFCAPSTQSATPVPARRTAYLQLLAALNNPHLTCARAAANASATWSAAATSDRNTFCWDCARCSIR
jgi:c-di-GMP-related signal transduction protein